MNIKAIVIATAIGTIFQVGMVVIGHFVPAVKGLFGPGGMILSLLAGFLFARLAGITWSDAVIGGGCAGAACAFLGIAVSFLLRDVPASLLALGTVASAVAGVVGGAIAKAIGQVS